MNAASPPMKAAAGIMKRLVLWFYSEIRWVTRVIISSADRFYWDNGFSKAASLAYTSLVSLVPAVALAFAILASFAVSNEYVPEVREFLFKQFVPSNEFVDQMLEYLTNFSNAIYSLNVLVIGFLVVTSLLLLNSIEYALNETWQVFESRPILHRIAIFSAIILIAPVLLLSAYYFTELRIEPLIKDIGATSRLYRLYTHLLPWSIDFFAFFCLYFLVPKAPVKVASAFFGAFVAALLFAGAKGGFAVYLEEFASYDKIYKTLAAIPVSLLWLYLGWIILLYGAETSYQAQYLPRNGKLWKRSLLSLGDARLLLAVQALVIICGAFIRGEKLPSDLDLAEALGCSQLLLKPAIDTLERAGIVARSNTPQGSLTLQRSPDKISLQAIKTALCGDSVAVRFPAELERLFCNLKSCRCTSEVTLKDLLQ